MRYTSYCGRIALRITKRQAESCAHRGPCDREVRALSMVPSIERQLAAIPVEELRRELKDYDGVWADAGLQDHAQNLQRLLWLACNDIAERS